MRKSQLEFEAQAVELLPVQRVKIVLHGAKASYNVQMQLIRS